jgi:hypothetical protein
MSLSVIGLWCFVALRFCSSPRLELDPANFRISSLAGTSPDGGTQNPCNEGDHFFERLKVRGPPRRHVFHSPRPTSPLHIGMFAKLHHKRPMGRQRGFVCRRLIHVVSRAQVSDLFNGLLVVADR